jgi:hypothetical protein
VAKWERGEARPVLNLRRRVQTLLGIPLTETPWALRPREILPDERQLLTRRLGQIARQQLLELRRPSPRSLSLAGEGDAAR